MFTVDAAAGVAFGSALGVEFAVVTAGFALGAACTVIAAARLSGSVSIALLVTVFVVALDPRSYSYPKILLYAIAALVMISPRAPDLAVRWLVALAGITAIAFLFRHDHGLFIGIGSFAVIVASSARGHTPPQRPLAVFVGSLAAFLAPWALFVQLYQGLVQYLLVGNRILTRRGGGQLAARALLPLLHWSEGDTLRNGYAWLFYLFHLLPLACFGIIVSRKFCDRAWPGETAAVAALAIIAIPVNVTFLRGSLEGRIPDAAVTTALLGAWLLGMSFRSRDGSRRLRIVFAVSIIAVTAWATLQGRRRS